jgi:hypothetical protein
VQNQGLAVYGCSVPPTLAGKAFGLDAPASVSQQSPSPSPGCSLLQCVVRAVNNQLVAVCCHGQQTCHDSSTGSGCTVAR